MKELLFGAAYYDEYMPYDRLDKDIEMMKKAGINTVRIAESTWSTCEPQEGVFDFSHVERVMDVMEEAGGLPGALSKVGLDIFVDPRKEGSASTESLLTIPW